jgi:Amidase
MPGAADERLEHELLVIKQIAGLAPLVFIMGGFAEAALLGLRRPHKDLDLLAQRGKLDQQLEQLKAVGLGEYQVVLADPSGQPLMLSGHWGGLEFEIYVATPEPGGGYQFEVPARGAAGRLRLFSPADTFQYPATTIEGISLQTISPLALWLHPSEAVEAAIARIEALNPRLNAVITPLFEQAREQAARPDLPDGPFRGVPVLLKDCLCQTQGDPYYEGMRFLREVG